jgi:DNA primase
MGGNAFRRDALPPPLSYLQCRGLLRTEPHGEWASIRCPIHKGGGESHPSLRISLVDGHFRCMACGAKGGDVLALHRLLTGATFPQAARELGAMQ